MSVPSLVAVGTDISGGANVVQKPLGVQLGDLLVVSFLMNGTPTVPTGWTIKFAGDDANVVAYARVDGTNIPADDDGQTFVFGNGGGAVYYTHSVGLVRGAEDAGDPFDGALTLTTGSGASTTAAAKTTTVDDVLLLLMTHQLFVQRTATNVTAPLVLFTGAAGFSHVASAGFPTPGPSGNKTVTYGGATTANWAQFGAIKPAIWGPTEGRMYPGGRDRFTCRRTPKNRRRYRP